MTPLGLYEPGTSLLHRTPAGPSLLALLVFAAGTVAVADPRLLAGACGLVALGFVVARIPWRRIRPLLRTLVLVLVLVGGIQWWLLGPERATVIALRLVAAIGAATLFTLTTRVDDLVSAVQRAMGPLRRFGVDPETVGLLVGLTIQSVGTLSGIAGQVRAAAKARGAGGSVTAFAVPFMVRTLRHADALGEALAARGWGDSGDSREDGQDGQDGTNDGRGDPGSRTTGSTSSAASAASAASADDPRAGSADGEARRPTGTP
ncbi:energy-coupling factor transporter transmembrane component T [Pseudonocardia sp. NPDC046786]|uniref:energy-coupling factor transporter transmembrane component T family protein n=1 Tax=Pseudonocardia sp. NPDC046786 TaxID=3155471 RepID=UPI0033E4CC51